MDNTEIKRIIRDCYEELYTKTYDNLEEIERFLVTYKKDSGRERKSGRTIITEEIISNQDFPNEEQLWLRDFCWSNPPNTYEKVVLLFIFKCL